MATSHRPLHVGGVLTACRPLCHSPFSLTCMTMVSAFIYTNVFSMLLGGGFHLKDSNPQVWREEGWERRGTESLFAGASVAGVPLHEGPSVDTSIQQSAGWTPHPENSCTSESVSNILIKPVQSGFWNRPESAQIPPNMDPVSVKPEQKRPLP